MQRCSDVVSIELNEIARPQLHDLLPPVPGVRGLSPPSQALRQLMDKFTQSCRGALAMEQDHHIISLTPPHVCSGALAMEQAARDVGFIPGDA